MPVKRSGVELQRGESGQRGHGTRSEALGPVLVAEAHAVLVALVASGATRATSTKPKARPFLNEVAIDSVVVLDPVIAVEALANVFGSLPHDEGEGEGLSGLSAYL